MLTVGSLFSGIGGLELGLERAGMRTIWQVEKDEYACRVLAKHWPTVLRVSDVRGAGAHNLPRPDIICGGFPCQDISSAGKRAGITGERSGLWKEFARIIRELRPRYVLVENVAPLRSRGLDVVLGDLAACGFDAEWDCIPAAAVGAHHRRDRLFLVAYTPGRSQRKPADEAHHVATGGHPRHEPGRGGSDVPDPDRQGLAVGEIFDGHAAEELQAAFRGSRTGAGVWAAEPNVGRVADGVPARVDRLRGTGNAVVPQVAEFLGRLILAHAKQRTA